LLSELHIEDFALIDRLTVSFAGGLCVFTGETGAGKSILIEALGLALGDRGDVGVIRSGRDRTEVSAVFLLDGCPDTETWLQEAGLENEDGLCILRRQLGSDGRSRCQVNGRPVTLAQLREVAGTLVDVHGQNTHQSLTRAEAQRELLDRWAGLETELGAVASCHREWLRASQRAAEIQHIDPAMRQRELELLAHEIEVLERLDCSPARLRELEQAHTRAAHAETLQHGITEVLALIEDAEPSARELLLRALRRLRELQRYEAGLGAVADALDATLIGVDEGVASLRRLVEGVDTDPAELARLEQRLADVHAAARRHRSEPGDLFTVLAGLQSRQATLAAGDGEAAERAQALALAEREYLAAAEALHQARLHAAPDFGAAVAARMQYLGLGAARFSVAISAEAERITRHGSDRIEFLVSTNAGQPERPLGKVASGGEVARIALAIQVVLAGVKGVPSLIFDEVDSGIGGRTAEIVGRELRRLAGQRQVLCVTHLAQVAAQGQQHLAVSKEEAAGVTCTRVTPLDGAARITELARMLGGINVGQASLDHAAAMLTEASAPG
jgi:DNA repair protein RecN (Recombination protein N)